MVKPSCMANETMVQACELQCGARLIEAIEQVRRARRLGTLHDATFLANVTRDAGLTYYPRGAIYGSEARHMLTFEESSRRTPPSTAGLGQLPVQFGGAVAALAAMNITSLLEIGTAGGWTVSLLVAALAGRQRPREGMRAHSTATLTESERAQEQVQTFRSLSLDIRDLRTCCTRRIQESVLGHGFMLIPARLLPISAAKAHASFAREQAAHLGKNGIIDLCFIDGDHSFEAVRRDYESLRGVCNALMFHDIVDRAVPGVPRFWHALKRAHADAKVWEFVEQPPPRVTLAPNRLGLLGIGIMRRPLSGFVTLAAEGGANHTNTL